MLRETDMVSCVVFWGVLFLVLGLSEELTWSMQMQMVAFFFALVES